MNRREASIKQEGVVGTEEEETISMEHYAMLEVVDCPTKLVIAHFAFVFVAMLC